MGKTLNVLQAFFEFLEYFYPRDFPGSTPLVGDLAPVFVRRMNYPDGLQFQPLRFSHS
jgi:hypothetical protein